MTQGFGLGWLRHRSDEIRLAAMFLTRLPMGRIERQMQLGQSSWSWPLIGAGLGLCFAALFAGAQWIGLPLWPAVVLAMGLQLLLTGGLHEDGLADLADGSGARGNAAVRLEVMRDSRLGSYGALALIFGLGLQATLWASLPAAQLGAVAVICAATSRAALPLWMARFKMARANGLAQYAQMGDSAMRQAVALLAGLVLALAASMTASGPFWGHALAAFGLCILVQWGLCLYARRMLGGITGDVMGAAQVIGQAVALAALTIGAAQ